MSSLQASCDAVSDQKSFILPFSTNRSWNTQSEQSSVTLAHEVRNPLTSINLSVEMLNSAITDAELRSYLDIILRGSARINQLINEILKNQDIEEIPVSHYSLHQLLDEALAMTTDRLTLKKIRLRKEYAMEEDRIFVDKEKVKSALVNIIINAIDAMSYEKGELLVTTRSIGKKYAVEIADNGTGISKENLQNIFKPYFSNKPGGMGLGLSTTLEILQYNHISVDVSSEEGQGTSFILFIDIAP